MKITKHFSLEEFACRDGTSYPENWITSRLEPLCRVLEILRHDLGMPVSINSGYRTPSYNRKIGGARHSQHVNGAAADIAVVGHSSDLVHNSILNLHRTGAIKIGGLGNYVTFTHIDIRPGTRLARWSGSRISN